LVLVVQLQQIKVLLFKVVHLVLALLLLLAVAVVLQTSLQTDKAALVLAEVAELHFVHLAVAAQLLILVMLVLLVQAL
jgi:hypothetical protein